MITRCWMSFEFHKKRIFMNTFLCMVGVQLAHTDCPSEICYPCHKLIMKNEEYIYNMAMQFFTSLHIIHNKVSYSKVSKKILVDLFKTSISWYHLTHFQLL